MLVYAFGLRISEAVTLPVTAVDLKQMVLHVIGKWNKQRASSAGVSLST
jgi:site-specific recombinase XerD